MASLHEYFIKDGAQNLTTQQTFLLSDAGGAKLGEGTARLHLDFEANATYISFYIPDMPGVACPEVFALNQVPAILKWPETEVGVQAGIGQERKDARELVFTGQIYLYSGRPVAEEHKRQLVTEARAVGHILTFRSTEYVNADIARYYGAKQCHPLSAVSPSQTGRLNIWTQRQSLGFAPPAPRRDAQLLSSRGRLKSVSIYFFG